MKTPNRTTRAELIARVRSALGPDARRTPGDPPATTDTLARLCQPGADLTAAFVERAAAGGLLPRRCEARALDDAIAAILRAANARRVALGISHPHLRAIAERAAAAAGATTVAGDPFDADAGVTDAEAVAETGSLVIASGRDRGRTAWLVPPVHIAIVRACTIVPDLLDLWPRAARTVALPASLVLVSGPSKTADIEGVLITGVHGPGTVHVLVVADL